jgi:hypothetical protein
MNGMMISKNSMMTKTTTAITCVNVEYFPGDQVVQRGEVAGAWETDQRADQHG